jgi:hypothetical protein
VIDGTGADGNKAESASLVKAEGVEVVVGRDDPHPLGSRRVGHGLDQISAVAMPRRRSVVSRYTISTSDPSW